MSINNKQYKFWEILKMCTEGELQDNDILNYIYNGKKLSVTVKSFKKANEITFKTIFSIQEKEYMTFSEARRCGRLLKHKNWKDFVYPIEALNDIYMRRNLKSANNMLDSKVWEIEE